MPSFDPFAAAATSQSAQVDRLNAESRLAQAESPGRAIALAERALALAEQALYPAGAAESHLILGRHRRSLAQYDLALNHLLQALHAFETLDLPLLRVEALNNLTPIYGDQGDWATALQYGLQALELSQAAGHGTYAAEAQNNIGFTYVHQREFAKALPYLQASLDHLRAAGDQRAQSFVLDSLCHAYRGLGDNAAALAAGQESVTLAAASGETRQHAEGLVSVGAIYLAEGDLGAAEAAFEQALAMAAAEGYVLQQVLARRHMSSVRARRGDLAGALADCHAALALAETAEARLEVYRCHELLAGLYKQRGEFEAALRHHEQFHAVYAQVHSAAAARRETELYQLRSAALEREIAERGRVEAALRELATTDALTGLATRRHFFELAERAIAHSRRYHRPLTVMMLDVDRLKQVNDLHGHAMGDEVIRAVGRAIRDTLRQVDIAGRYGGDELAIVLPETSAAAAAGVADRLRAAMHNPVVRAGQTHLLLSVSIGLASNESTPDATLEALLDRADHAMYQAKGGGRHVSWPTGAR